ncbi:VOC family protein [Actinopolymorpha sp. NPDC004070]|uniref:VOC family protein n=1 Tax=Actinopolymorpha sp. NPDC004070 TaxID=3154548 RepID=UPI00339F6E69
MSRTCAEASVEVDVDRFTAFAIFTEEIDLWWVRGPINHFDSSRLAELRMERGVGGRVLEIYDESTGDVLETDRITVWEPGARLVLRGSVQDTETDVRFEPTGTGGTRVLVSQYLRPGGDPASVGFGWANMLRTFSAWSRRRDTAPRTPREIGRLGLALSYEDPVAAARWLDEVFGLGSWDVDRPPEEGERPGWIEFHVGDSLVMLFQQESAEPVLPRRTHVPWVYVDDLDAHFAHARDHGARIVSGIAVHAVRSYVAEDLEGHQWVFVQARPTQR